MAGLAPTGSDKTLAKIFKASYSGGKGHMQQWEGIS